MAQHAPLTQFLARLNTDLGDGTHSEFLAATGRRLVAGHVLPDEEFPRTGAPNASDLGSLLRTLHSLGGAVDWAGAATAGHASKIEFFASVGIELAVNPQRTFCILYSVFSYPVIHARTLPTSVQRSCACGLWPVSRCARRFVTNSNLRGCHKAAYYTRNLCRVLGSAVVGGCPSSSKAMCWKYRAFVAGKWSSTQLCGERHIGLSRVQYYIPTIILSSTFRRLRAFQAIRSTGVKLRCQHLV